MLIPGKYTIGHIMNSEEQPAEHQELPTKARRVIFMIRVAMAVMIVTPFVLVWLTAALKF